MSNRPGPYSRPRPSSSQGGGTPQPQSSRSGGGPRYDERPPQRDERPRFNERPPQRDERPRFNERPPQRDERPRFDERPSARDDRRTQSERGFAQRENRRDETIVRRGSAANPGEGYNRGGLQGTGQSTNEGKPFAPKHLVDARSMDALDRARQKTWVGRGALKLLAAIEQFGIADRFAWKRVLDVGASTGGFTEVVLHFGASHVTAIDVGFGQMVDSLRHDRRVELLERTHFKTVSLSVAPGPFDFFVTDVSFMASRTLLKPLGKRIAPGTIGVILLKPQFELPDSLLPKGGVVASRNLRKFALNRFRRKADALGFEILDRMDSPIHGGEGNVEMLLLMRFNGFPVKPDGSPQEVEDDD